MMAVNQLAFWFRYRMRRVVAHKLSRHEWRWLQPIPDEISPVDHGWWRCEWCGANKSPGGTVSLPKPYKGEPIWAAAEKARRDGLLPPFGGGRGTTIRHDGKPWVVVDEGPEIIP